ncbi:hypothetical protein FKM82_008553 [Ascaphus truei]
MAAPMRAAGCGVSEAHDGNPPLVREGVQSHPGSAGHRETLRLFLIFQCCLYVSARNSLLDDLLLPYPPLSKHGPNHSHRNVRDCQPIAHGNTTHEEWPSNNNTQLPVATTTVFVSKFLDANNEKTVYGHFTFVNNPLRTFSVLEPGGTGGCSKNLTATVEETATYGKCIVAQNGGYFNTSTGTCLGNIVSNSMLVQNSRGIQNAQFGIRADGTMVFGLNLWEMANFLKGQGVINAINLDGGGSATLVINGTLSNYPSDHCVVEPKWRCPRSISTVLCVHEPFCDPPDCGGHGQCVVGECQCTDYWTGPACKVLYCGPSNCSGHGTCTQNGCACDAGWMGSVCDNACVQGFYGDGCTRECHCQNNGTCDHVDGTCGCLAGYKGLFCEQVCSLGFFGPQCQQICRCDQQCYCHHVTGSCNITHEHPVNYSIAKVGRCLESVMFTSWEKSFRFGTKDNFLTEKTWIVVCGALALLLAVSVAFHARQAPWCKGDRQGDGKYSYHQLQEMNGNMNVAEMCEPWDMYEPEPNVENRHSEAERSSRL